jgi:predicted DNA-binding protein (UPF0251 family)
MTVCPRGSAPTSSVTQKSRKGRSSPPDWTRSTSERQIVELRFFQELTQSQIASEIGISQMHVSRLLRRALATMRGRIEEGAPRE